MKIVFVRHGHPDYASGHLTELGHAQAGIAAKKLATYGIERIYASSLTRAIETAEYTARELGQEIEILDWIRELNWGSINDEPILEKGHPWLITDRHAEEGRSLTDPNWASKEPWCNNKILSRLERVTVGFDAFMEKYGYRREGEFYRVIGNDTEKTIAIFGHGGSFTAIFAHLMNIPFPLACRVLALHFTCISVANFDNRKDVFCMPHFDVIGDAKHIEGVTVENTFMA